MPKTYDFDKLPNSAGVSVSIVALVTGTSEATIWRRAKTEPLLKPVHIGPRCTRFNVGNLRKLLSGEA